MEPVGAGKKQKAVFQHYRGFQDESLHELISEVLGYMPDEFQNMAFAADPEWDRDFPGPETEPADIQNVNQELVVAYLEGQVGFSPAVQAAYLNEINADSPNSVLFKTYFYQPNHRLMHLLLGCIQDNPTDPSLLNDLAILHESLCILDELTTLYIRACVLERDPFAFACLAEAFYYNTVMDGYDAFQELAAHVGDNPEKLAIIDYLITRHMPERQSREPLHQ
ncbi:MAG: hypothetical protein AB7S77_04430 [Desulfatirhabdiaceae bacterium]